MSSIKSIANTTPEEGKNNYQRFEKLQKLVMKKTQVQLSLNEQEKAVLVKTWGQPSDQNSLSYMISTSIFWDEVRLLLKTRSTTINTTATDQLIITMPGLIRMAMLSLDDLNNMDDFLANLGRIQRRLYGMDLDQIFQLGLAIIDSLFAMRSDEKLYKIGILEIWWKLYCFFANSMIEAFGIDPVILTVYEDPFALPQLDVDSIIETHFKGEDVEEPMPLTVVDKTNTVTVIEEPVAEDDDSDIYDIFLPSPATRKPVSVTNYAQLQRSQGKLNTKKILNKTGSNNKQLNFFKKLLVRATID